MNGSIDNLREAVLTDARALAYEIMQDAKKESDKVAAEATARMAEDRAAAMANTETEAAGERQRLLAEAEAGAQRERLVGREEMIDKVLDEVRKRLRTAASDSAKGRDLLLRLCTEGAKSVSGETVKLVVRRDDRSRVDAAFLGEVKRQTGKRAELSDEVHDGLGGIIVTSADGRERLDNTLDNRLERQMADVRAMIWARVSHAG